MIVMPALSAIAGSATDTSKGDHHFIHPPLSARPWCFYMWMNGNITREGITADLEAMKRMGIGGVICFNCAVGIPRGPVDYAGKDWIICMQHTAREAERLGIELSMHNSPGYSGAGGPWITPEMSMQQLVFTETRINTSGEVNTPLPQPHEKQGYYRDAMVIAYPSLPAEQALMKEQLHGVWLNGISIDKKVLTDGNAETMIRMEASNNHAELLLVFDIPFEARAITVLRRPEVPDDLFDGPRDKPPVLQLEYSEDGVHYQKIGVVRLPELREADTPAALSFAPVKARYYRLIANSNTWNSELELHNGPRLAGWPGKTGNTHGDTSGATPVLLPEEIIQQAAVKDVTRYMNEGGILQCTLPPGRWTVLRLGHTTTGECNAAHPDAAKGLELDKFRKEALNFHFEHFLGNIIQVLKHAAPTHFKGVTIDSWEAGKQNWTIHFPAQFQQIAGYAITAWMPALTGRIVGSVNETERFLWDVRKVQAQLLSDNFYGHFHFLCKENGMELYAEPYGDGNFDSLAAAKHLDITMSEFWTRYLYGSDMTSLQAASAAHIYGKRIVAAEAFTAMPLTSKWTDYPFSLKAEGDYFMTRGINRLVFHTFVHQPYSTGKPGMTMGPFGMHMDRHNTWAEQAHGYTAYLQRTQYLLQQGTAIADICYYKGDNPESGIPVLYSLLPAGYKADVFGPDALQTRFNVQDGDVVLPNGMRYRLCVMASLSAVPPASLQRLYRLVTEGMTLLVLNKPAGAPGLGSNDKEVQNIVQQLYGNADGIHITENKTGKGKLIWGQSIAAVLHTLGVEPDFTYNTASGSAAIHYIHKQWQGADYYFISNQRRREEQVVCSFRMKGKQPEIWNSETGEQYEAVVYGQQNGRILLPLTLPPAGAVFVIFRKPAGGKVYTKVVKDGRLLKGTDSWQQPVVAQAAVTGNFTITLWAKPDTYAHKGRSLLLHAAEAATVWGDGKAAVAIGAGQNGIRVYECNKGTAEEVLFAAVPLSGWSHIALVYRNNTPALYLNGQLVATGQPSQYQVVALLDMSAASEQFNNYFEGNYTRAALTATALDADAISGLAAQGLPSPALPAGITLKRKGNGIIACAFENGNYHLIGKHTEKWTVEGCRQLQVKGPWQLQFQPAGHPSFTMELPALVSLHRHENNTVRYFSGTVTYSKNILLETEGKSSHKKWWLHLGRVEVVAQVKVNGKGAGLLWKEPFMIDISAYVQQGINTLEIAVTNLWPNRLIGDEQLKPEHAYGKDNNILKLPDWYVKQAVKPGMRQSFSVWKTHDKDSPLLESGLLGPVTLLTAIEKTIH